MNFDPGWNQNNKPSERRVTQLLKVTGGVWVVRKPMLGSIVSIHESELEALRAVNENGLGKAEFVPWGKILVDTDHIIRDQGGRNDA